VRASGIRRIILLTLGWEVVPKSISVYGDTSGERLREPVPGILLEADGGWILLDTGLNPALIRDAPLNRRFHGRNKDIEVMLPGPGEPLEEALDAAGVSMDKIVTVAVSHLHNDHAGGIRLHRPWRARPPSAGRTRLRANCTAVTWAYARPSKLPGGH
jgi:glyoxylase-like metal-dependent hydrolase (beta-lactamase superfamily II)